MEYLTLGTIVTTFGLKGEVKVYSETDFASMRYRKGNKVFLFNKKDNSLTEMEVSKYRADKGMDLVQFKNYEDINKIEKFVGCEVRVLKDQKDLPKDTYFFDDLRKCDVVDENGNILGHVKQVEEYASYNTLRVARDNDQKDFFVPFVEAFIKKVDIENYQITINVMKGLLD